MAWRIVLNAIVLIGIVRASASVTVEPGQYLATLKEDQKVSGFRVANVYSDSDGRIVGVKFWHMPSGAPVFLLQIETVPQVYTWVDTPVNSDRGLPHALEHLLAEKGTKGRYFGLLRDMRLSQSAAATWRDFNFYSFSSGSGMDGFFELFHAWLDALYYPDFTDTEAEREFYHFGVTTDPTTNTRTLTEGGSVYNEEQTDQGEESCYHDLDKRVLGNDNPLAANIGGAPDQMRNVTAHDIREFHSVHYRLGPTTGFIFAIHPKENVLAFLQRVSSEFDRLVKGDLKSFVPVTAPGNPKYSIHSSDDNQPRICPVPGANEGAPADVWFAWKPKGADSMIDVRLLGLLFRGLADGQRSLLYKSIVDSKTRTIDTGATNVMLDPAVSESPRFLLWKLYVSGISSSKVSVETITQLRNAIVAKIKDISEYPDNSEALTGFNRLISSYAQASTRSNRVWRRNPPLFGVLLDAKWKDFFDYLEMDSSFVRSLSEDGLWRQIDRELRSGKNVWRDVIHKFNLLDPPYASATPTSAHLLHKLETEKQERISNKIRSLRESYGVAADQEALGHFEQQELVKTKEIDQIESRVLKPSFTDHPPLTPDDDIRYSKFPIVGVPTIATLFDRPPTLEIGLSFDLHQVPRKYYKYLPILARCFDSLGLKEGNHIIPYSELLSETRSRFVDFAAGTADNGVSHRADLTFRASVTSVSEFRQALRWMERSIHSSYLDLANVGRLRDIVAERSATDDSYTKQDEFSWVFTPAQAFRYQGDPLYLALESQFTRAHWDGRLLWLLHEPVSPSEIDGLAAFARRTLAIERVSRSDLAQKLSTMDAKGLEGEIVDYWKRNLSSFPENKLVEGLQELTLEVQRDLRTGPAKTINELQELKQLVINRQVLQVDLLISSSTLASVRQDLAKFLSSIPNRPLRKTEDHSIYQAIAAHPIIDKLAQRNGFAGQPFPLHLGFVVPEEGTGNAIFYSDFVNYSKVDRTSLLKLLSTGLLAGRGPGSFYMKSREAGLSYALMMQGDPSRGLIVYYADRSLDLPSLVSAMNSGAEGIANMRDKYLVDYALRQIFTTPRSIYTFSIREHVFAQEMRDGNTPEKVRQFYETLLKLRNEPDLLSELTRVGRDSLCGILLDENCRRQQEVGHSIFFFVGSDTILSDAENRAPIPKLLRVWPSDYWLE